MEVRMLNLGLEVERLRPQLTEAIEGVLASTQFIMGAPVKEFETEIAAYTGAKHAIGCNSGTDALMIAARALDLKEGDEVITTPFTFFATVEPLLHLGVKAVFVDIDPETFNMNVDEVAPRINSRTKAIIPVHLFGQAVDMDPLVTLAAEHDLAIVEDVAQAFGADYQGNKLGTIGDIGCLSFFPSKNLGAYGDGGMMLTDDDEMAEKLRMLRNHGARKKYHNEVAGYNSRLDTLQAAILRTKLPHLDWCNARRLEAATYYSEALAEVEGLSVPATRDYGTHVFHQYTLRVNGGRRDELQESLKVKGVSTEIYYPVAIHKLEPFADFGYELPEAERAAAEVLSLPIGPDLTREEQDYVIQAIKESLS
ncbi:MAG: DegT/DnrJ/EryC1/StrS family aminotransferase [Candidatus Berkelbacteria bacterium]|nr:MAG: DegT/DnrJ/EryC1/StrS family aminotransferase [Candidatus Berkelbacteria bacterium]QQG51681.1 MAG: DegT/DnrJ/EryC1/StrS family aminotransferase [Candidatus Berkelbacteria bacterium]